MNFTVGLIVWHRNFGKGYITEVNDTSFLVCFESIEEKRFSRDSFGISVFDDEAELSYTDLQYLMNKYSAPKELVSFSQMQSDDYTIQLIEQGELRTFVILSAEKQAVGNHLYYRIIGVDVISANIVVLVDTNGMKYGLHTDQIEIHSLSSYDVIQTKVKSAANPKQMNTLRIVSRITVCGRSNIKKLVHKIENFANHDGYSKHGIVMHFDAAIFLSHLCKGTAIHAIVNFTGTDIRKAPGEHFKLQLKMGPVFADIEEKVPVSFEGLHYRGLALISAFAPLDGHRARVRVVKLFAKPTQEAVADAADEENRKRSETFDIRYVDLENMLIDPAYLEEIVRGYVIDFKEYEGIYTLKDFYTPIKKALCDLNGNLTNDQFNLFQFVVGLFDTPIEKWSAEQDERFFGALMRRVLRDQGLYKVEHIIPESDLKRKLIDVAVDIEMITDYVCGIDSCFEHLVKYLTHVAFADDNQLMQSEIPLRLIYTQALSSLMEWKIKVHIYTDNKPGVTSLKLAVPLYREAYEVTDIKSTKFASDFRIIKDVERLKKLGYSVPSYNEDFPF